MRLPKHSALVLILATLVVALGVAVATLVQTTQTLADQRIVFPLYRNQFTTILDPLPGDDAARQQSSPFDFVVGP
jgi:hypothetical protein